MSALASQLRLVRDTVQGPAAVLLAELIAEAEAPPPATDAADEAARQRAIEAQVMIERQARVRDAVADTLDFAALAAFLNRAVPGEGAITVTDARTVSRGMSKKTVLVTIAGARTLPADLALRVDRSGNNYLGTTVIDEWGPLQRLWDHGAPIPQPFALENSGTVIGDPFIAFARAAGEPVGSIYAPPGPNPGLIVDVAQAMARVHAVPVDHWPRADQPRGDAFFDAQFAEYRADWRALGETNTIMDACFAWIERHRALAYGPPALVHDDFNFNNMLVADGRVVAVLDWEFAHVGTPAADLAYLWYAAQSASSFAAFLDAYAAAGGTVPPREQLDFYRLWGQLRLGVMGFKAVRNLEQGHFDDVRFGLARWHRRQALLRLGALL
jgi:aminoglycoside phosphotransferase (APT) family kinase protein